jgi:2-oxoglutarate ferredoxin oxidoreductase subunit delta
MSKIVVDPERCKGCKLCLAACPKKLIAIGDAINSHGYRYAKQIDADKCIGCKLCAIMCPDSAISVYKED